MEIREIQAIIEAVLFAAGDAVELERLADITDVDKRSLREILKKMMNSYSYERRGIHIIRMEDSYQMCSASDLAGYVTRALETRKPPKLSASQLESLTVIAYYQPATKAYVETIRGVDSSYSVNALLNKHLIEECGRLNAPGRPILYRTTPDFLRVFGLESLEDLPPMEKMSFSAELPLPETPGAEAEITAQES